MCIRDRSRTDLLSRTDRALEVVSRWCVKVKLELSATKTTALMLKDKFHRGRRPTFQLNGERVGMADSVRYLGLQMQEGMIFAEHVAQQTQKVLSVFLGLAALMRTSGGLECSALKRLYEGTAVPLLTYGCEVWGPTALRTKALRRQLMKTQRKVVIMINKAYRTISHEANLVIAGVIPIDLLIGERVAIKSDTSRGINREVAKMMRRRETLDSWQRRWEESDKGRTTFSFIPNIWDRINSVLNTDHYATQFLSGHGNFKARLAAFRLAADPWCGHCGDGVEETAWHVLAECPRFVDERNELVDLWERHPGEDRQEIVCWNPEFFRIFCRTARKVGRAKEGRRLDAPQE